MQNIIVESPTVIQQAKNVKTKKNGRCRMECCLQTANCWNRNNRFYSDSILKEGINRITNRVKENSLLGELDHPLDSNPVRQLTVLYKCVSHEFKELGWDGNKLIGIIETVRTPNGDILKNLAEDGVRIGFSMRGMGDLQKGITEKGRPGYIVQGPLNIITYDSVSFPSHAEAQIIKITESVMSTLQESYVGFDSIDGMIQTEDGFCYFPNDFDRMVEERIIKLKDKYILKKNNHSDWVN